MTKRRTATVAMALALAACSGGGMGASRAELPQAQRSTPPAGLNARIKHIVIVVQENRSFDNIFSGYPGAVSATSGQEQANGTVQTIPLHPVTFNVPMDMDHTYTSGVQSYDGGKMDGFNLNTYSDGGSVGTFPYAYLERSLVAPYWAMASKYVLADHMFPTMMGASFTAHLDLIAGTADLNPNLSEVNWPNDNGGVWGCDAHRKTKSSVFGPGTGIRFGPFPCFTQFSTIADTLDAAHVSWKYYAPGIAGVNSSADAGGLVWSEFDAIKKVRYGADWANIVTPPTTFLSDAAAGTLPSVSWVIPDWLNSDHAAAHNDSGPSWVAAVVNAVGKGPDWNSTAIVVLWDDWGGWYDSVPPPQLDWKGLGIRVPALVISPYAKKGYVTHTVYEFASTLKLVEQTFGLPVIGPASFGYTDTRAASMLDAFDFTQKPRAFTPIPAKYPASHFLHIAPSMRAPDDD
jgi:phospholipase C